MVKINDIKEQSRFCLNLMEKLNKEIHNAELNYNVIKHHYRMTMDILRIRRELITLKNMLMNYIQM